MQTKWQRAKQSLLEGRSPWGGQKGMGIKGHEETFRGKKCVQHCTFGDNFIGLWICQSLSNCTLEICAVCCVLNIPQWTCGVTDKEETVVGMGGHSPP